MRSTEIADLSCHHETLSTILPTQLRVRIVPSDKELAFPLPELCFLLDVPLNYPGTMGSSPTLVSIETADIPASLCSWISKSFNNVARAPPRRSLVEMVDWLDKNIENLLAGPPATLAVGAVHIASTSQKTRRRAAVAKLRSSPSEEIFSEIKLTPGSCDKKDTLSENDQICDSLIINDQVSQKNETIDLACFAVGVRRGAQLQGIAFAESTAVSLLLKCATCAELTEIRDLNDKKQRMCVGCTRPIAVFFRSSGVSSLHAGAFDEPGTPAVIIATLHLSGASTVVDVLGVHYSVSCTRCLTETPIVAEKASRLRATGACVACNLLMTIEAEPFSMENGLLNRKIAESKRKIILNQNSYSSEDAQDKRGRGFGSKKRSEGLLAQRGTCAHYSKSYRWFRFSCCGRCYPCDECHEARKPDSHEMKMGHTMLCGFCSCEQPCSDTCSRCRASVTSKASKSGFWEGGQGTRNRTQMSNKDGHKHSNLSKTESRRSVAARTKK